MVSEQLLAQAGQVASEECRGNVSWHKALRSELVFPPPLYFQNTEVTSVHVPHAWDARETQSMGGAPKGQERGEHEGSHLPIALPGASNPVA